MSSYAKWAEEEKRRRAAKGETRAYRRYVERRGFEEIHAEVSRLSKDELVDIVAYQVKKIFDKLEPEQEMSVMDAIRQLGRR